MKPSPRLRSICSITWAVILLYTLSPTGIYAQTRAFLRVDTNVLWVGGQVHMELAVSTSEEAEISLPNYREGDTLSKNIEIIKRLSQDTIDTLGMRLYRQQYILTVWDTGLFPLPLPDIHYIERGIEGMVRPITDKPYLYAIFPIKIQPNTLQDIKANLNTPLTIEEVMPWIFGILLVVSLIFLIFYFISRRKKRIEEEIFTAPKLPPHIEAIQALDNLEKKQLLIQGKVKAYHSEITEILRRYIGRRFDIEAPEMTTKEILTSLQFVSGEIPEQSFEKLAKGLEFADLVKFAKLIPEEEQSQEALLSAYLFVDTTKKEEEEEEEEEENIEDEQQEGKPQEALGEKRPEEKLHDSK